MLLLIVPGSRLHLRCFRWHRLSHLNHLNGKGWGRRCECSRAVGVLTTAAQTPNLGTLPRPMRIGVIPRQAAHCLPTALSLILLTRSHRFLRGTFGTLDRSTASRAKPHRYQSLGQFVRSNTWRICTDQANGCHLLIRRSCCSHFPSAWPHLQYCHAPVGAELAPSLWHERARYPALMQPSVPFSSF